MDQEKATYEAGPQDGVNDRQQGDSETLPRYPWPSQAGWMNQIQPLAPTQLPHAVAPIVYEGYMPHDENLSPQTAFTNSTATPWSAQTETPSAKTPRVSSTHYFSRNIGHSRPLDFTRSASPAFQAESQSHRLTPRRFQSPALSNPPGPQYLPNGVRLFGHLPVGTIPPIQSYQQPSSFQSQYPEGPLLQTRDATVHYSDGLSSFIPTTTNEYVNSATSRPQDLVIHDVSEDDGYSTNIDHRFVSAAKLAKLVQDTPNLTDTDQQEQPNEVPKKKTRRRRGAKQKDEKNARTGTREALDPGEDFKKLANKATEAFIDEQNHEKALGFILQAISINPEINSAHVMLSEIYFSQGQNDKAIAALFSGAHASPNDPEVWNQLADTCLLRSTADRREVLRQATYCFSRLLNINQDDHNARFQKAAISRELGHYSKAIKDLRTILKDMPYNASILKEVAEVCLDRNDAVEARMLYEDNLEQVRSGALTDPDAFTWAHLIVYVDLIVQTDGSARAIWLLKEIGRWLSGRASEIYWNNVTDDDREWDVEHIPRRSEVPHFMPGQYQVEQYGVSMPLELRIKLGELRLSQGQVQEALDHFEWLEPEAFDEGANVYEYPDLFLQVARALKDGKEFQQALRYYKSLLNINAEFEDEDAADFWLGIAASAYVCGERDGAIQYYENAKIADPDNAEPRTQLSKLYSDKGDREKALSHAREALGLYDKALPKTQRRKYERKEAREGRNEAQMALKKAYTLPKAPGEKDTIPIPSFSRRAREKARRLEREARESGRVPEDRPEQPIPKLKRRLTKKQRTRDQQEQYIRQLYTKLCSCTDAMRDGDDEARSVWLECAEALIEDFRSNKVFYPAERYRTFQGYGPQSSRRKDAAASQIAAPSPTNGADNEEDVPVMSIESAVPNDYHGIVFSSWLDIFLEYALLLANLQYEPSECYTVITAAQDCIVWYHDPDAMHQIYICYVASCIALQDESTLFNVALRWFMRELVFCTDAYRLFSAINLYYPHNPDRAGKLGQMSNAKFRNPANQKFLFRHVASLDSQLPESYGVGTRYGAVPDFARRERNELGYLRIHGQGRNLISGLEKRNAGNSMTPFTGTPQPQTPDAHNQNYVRSENRTFKPEEMDVVLLVVYGQALYAGGSFPSAMSYFFRAHSLDPSNPMVLLSIALCYMHQMFKRQNENRHMYLLQGWTFFEEYADARLKWSIKKTNKIRMEQGRDTRDLIDVAKREIEFNRARCWHMIGLADLAMRGYQKMIEMKRIKNEDEMDVDGGGLGSKEEYTMEAAYTMATMYAVNGDTESAREITEKWLVVE